MDPMSGRSGRQVAGSAPVLACIDEALRGGAAHRAPASDARRAQNVQENPGTLRAGFLETIPWGT